MLARTQSRKLSGRGVAAMVMVAMGLSSVAQADWRQFRGPGGQGRSDESSLPTEWDETKNIAWKISLPGYGSSSPIILGDRVYVTCYSGYGIDRENPGEMQDLRLHVLALNRTTGDQIWDLEIEPTLPESERVRDHGYAAATPATDGKTLYAFFGKSGVLAIDLNGKVLWRTSVGDGTHGWGCGTSPVLYENLVIVNASVESGDLVALNRETGEIVWRQSGMRSSWNTPHLVSLDNGATEVVVSVKDKILAYDPATGEPLWSCDGIEDYVCPSIVSADGIVYVIGGRRSQSIAVRAGGRGDVTETHKLWQTAAGANVSSPVVSGKYLFWVSDRINTAYCLDRETGEVIFSERMRGQPYASSVLADGKLYVVTRYSGTFVLAAQPEFQILAHNELDDSTSFNASPAVSDGSIFIRSDRSLYCIRLN